jgi:hypothetical protein
MSFAQYRLYLNGTAATKDQLARFEDITIEQEMDKACYGRFQVPICVCASGVWSGETDAFLQGMSRIRLEMQIQSAEWVPLIDGPIVNVEGAQFSDPGQSMLTLVVSDDSFYLHRDETVTSFEGSDDTVASQIFDQVSQIATTDIDTADSPSDPGFTKTVLRGTQMECLQRLARRQHMHAFVTPGDSPGQSVGRFKRDPDPAKDYGLAPMVLLGSGTNVFSFKSTTKAGQAATFQAGRVNLKDRSTDTQTSTLSDVALAGSTLPPGPTIKRLLRPGQMDALTLARAVQGASEKSVYALNAHGEVMKGVYTSVLQPYQFVQVRAANGTLSGNWLLHQVTHTITRNSYGQSFQAIRNATSAGTNSPLPQIPPSSVF